MKDLQFIVDQLQEINYNEGWFKEHSPLSDSIAAMSRIRSSAGASLEVILAHYEHATELAAGLKKLLEACRETV